MNNMYPFYLNLRAARDVKKNVFFSPEHIPDLLLSPYVCEQLTRYAGRRTRIMATAKIRIMLPDAHYRMHSRRVTLDSGLELLDAAIASLTAAITSENVLLERKLNELDQKRKLYIRDHVPHMVQLCDNQENQVWKQYYTTVLDLYRKTIDLLSAQASLITNVESRLTLVHSGYIERIETYYAKLADCIPGDTVRTPSPEELRFAGNSQLLSEYHMQKRDDVLRRRTGFQKTLDDIQTRMTP